MAPYSSPTGFPLVRQRTSFKISATTRQAQVSSPTLKEDSVTVYNLDKMKLKTWLENRFAGEKFEGDSIKMKGDKWMIMVPEKLSDPEKLEIYNTLRQKEEV